jgi:hypothetical protein
LRVYFGAKERVGFGDAGLGGIQLGAAIARGEGAAETVGDSMVWIVVARLGAED